MEPQAVYHIAVTTDTLVIIVDADAGRTITNDADRVVRRVAADVGGMGKRRLYYRDSQGRFDELRLRNGEFAGFAPCTEEQQVHLGRWVAEAGDG